MGRLCLIYNFAQRYRESIFVEIDKEWDCEWYFGKNTTDIKGMDLTLLKHPTEVTAHTFIKEPFYWQCDVVKLVRRKDISTFFILGDPHCISNWIIALYIKFFAPKKRLYFWTHGWYGKESKITAAIKKAFFKLTDGIFLYGNYARNLMIEQGFDPEKLFVIHNSLHYGQQRKLRTSHIASGIYHVHFDNDNANIIFIGRLTAVKKLDMLLHAIKILKARGLRVNVTFVGNGSETETLTELAAHLGIADNVWFYGACYEETKNAELIYNADLCVAPGNVGLTAMHSMVFGTPVISHNDFKWQMPEFEAIKPGQTGDFFEKDNVESLAEAITNWLAAHPDREAVRKACYEEIDNSWTPEFQMEVLRNNLKVD